MGLLRSDPVNTSLPPYARALLQAIAGGESGGRYNVRYTPGGGAEFDDLSKHPAIYEKGPHGPSSAAGRYQFTKQTWDGLGGGSFDPANQDARAWQLAQKDYRQRTGADLATDLQQKGYTPDIQRALSPTWAALGSGYEGKAANFKDSLSRYNAGGGMGTDPSGVMQVNPDGTLGLKANAPIGFGGHTTPMALGNGSSMAGLANPTMPGAATPVGLLGSNAPMQLPQEAAPPTAFASANLTPVASTNEAAAGLLGLGSDKAASTLGGLGSSLLSKAQPQVNPQIKALWDMAMSDGAQAHRGGFR